MAKVNKKLTFKKALQSFATYAVAIGAAMTQVEIPEGDLTDKALITLGLSAVAGVLRAINNVRKRSREQPKPRRAGVNYSNLVILIVMLSASVAVSSCAILEGADGSVTYRIDGPALETAWGIYEDLVDQKAALESQKRTASAAERAQLEAEIRQLEDEIQAAWNRMTSKNAEKMPSRTE